MPNHLGPQRAHQVANRIEVLELQALHAALSVSDLLRGLGRVVDHQAIDVMHAAHDVIGLKMRPQRAHAPEPILGGQTLGLEPNEQVELPSHLLAQLASLCDISFKGRRQITRRQIFFARQQILSAISRRVLRQPVVREARLDRPQHHRFEPALGMTAKLPAMPTVIAEPWHCLAR
jgi:hypothetical protein